MRQPTIPFGKVLTTLVDNSFFRAVRVFLSGLVDSSAFHEVSLGREVSIDFTSNGPLIHRWEANKYLTRVESHTRSGTAGSRECRSNAWGDPKRSPRPSCLLHPTRRLTSRVLPLPSTAANWPDNPPEKIQIHEYHSR